MAFYSVYTIDSDLFPYLHLDKASTNCTKGKTIKCGNVCRQPQNCKSKTGGQYRSLLARKREEIKQNKFAKAGGIDNKKTFEKLSKAGKVWEQHGKKRVYLDVPTLLDLSKNQSRRYSQAKFYFDIDKGFGHLNLSDQDFEKAKNATSWGVVK